MARRQLQGIITSDKMEKTVVVQVERLKEHPRYKRRFRSRKNYKAHDPKGEYHTGDKVLLEETRPLSKDKHWRVLKKL
ncbi:30S ribosomal protein S17 [Patescibacteria group bacterium]|nr:30S ribosomal protein S17 [Patescibacteria group bacterium]